MRADDVSVVLNLQGPCETLATELLAEKTIHYTDEHFEVCSNGYHFVMQLVHDVKRYVLFYVQVPHIYPMPEALKDTIKSNIESLLGQSITLTFVNAGVEQQKKDIMQSASFSIGDQ